MKKIFIILTLIITTLFLVGCASKTISEIKTESYVGKKVTITGVVKNTIKFGTLSGYTIEDSTGTIGVSSQNLPKEGEKVTVSGTLIKDTLFGYYIKTE